MRRSLYERTAARLAPRRFDALFYQGIVTVHLLTGSMLGLVTSGALWFGIALIAGSVLYSTIRGQSLYAWSLPPMYSGFLWIGEPLFDMLLWCTIAYFVFMVWGAKTNNDEIGS